MLAAKQSAATRASALKHGISALSQIMSEETAALWDNVISRRTIPYLATPIFQTQSREFGFVPSKSAIQPPTVLRTSRISAPSGAPIMPRRPSYQTNLIPFPNTPRASRYQPVHHQRKAPGSHAVVTAAHVCQGYNIKADATFHQIHPQPHRAGDRPILPGRAFELADGAPRTSGAPRDRRLSAQ